MLTKSGDKVVTHNLALESSIITSITTKNIRGLKFCGESEKMKAWGQPSKGRSNNSSVISVRDSCDASTHTVDEKDSKKPTEPSPDQSIDQLGMAKEQAVSIWDKQGRPIIHLGPGENCHDLAKLLAQREIKPEHLSAIKEWLEKYLEEKNNE